MSPITSRPLAASIGMAVLLSPLPAAFADDATAPVSTVTVPQPDITQLRVASHGAPTAAHDPNREEKHFTVPLHEGPAEALITKAAPTLELAAKEPDKKIRIKTFRRVDTMTVNKDQIDEVVSEFLQKVGQEYIISITPMTYTYKDLATEHYVTDYGAMVVFRG